MGVDTIPLYQLHSPDPAVPFEESLGSLIDLRREGKIRLIGLCNVGLRELRVALRMTTVASVQNRYSVLKPTSDGVLEVCQQQGMPFLPWFPLGGGRLVRSHGPLDQVAQERGVKPAQLALAWLLGRSPVILPIAGTASVAHLEENVAATGLHLAGAELEVVRRATRLDSRIEAWRDRYQAVRGLATDSLRRVR